MQEQKNLGLVLGIVGVSILLFGGLIFALVKAPSDRSVDGEPQDESVAFVDETDPVTGPDRSTVTVHLYEDFQCPACAVSHPDVQKTMERFKDRVRFVWKDFPLEQLHPNARPAANAARCAYAQNKFWEYGDKLYLKQSEWVSGENFSDRFVAYAREIGIDEAKFRACIGAKTFDGNVTNNLTEGLRNRVDRTPTFFINQKRYYGMSADEWAQAIEKELAP